MTEPNRGLEWRRVVRWLAATGGVLLATGLLTVARVNQTAAGMIFLGIVVWYAARVGFDLALYVAGLCAVSFDYFFIPPVRTLRLEGPQEWVEMLTFLVSSVIVGRLAERARRQTRDAEQRREDVERLYRLSQEMMLQEDAARLTRELPQMIQRSFALESVILYVREQDVFHGAAEISASAQATLRALTGGPNATLPGLEGYTARVLMVGLTPIGVLAWRPDVISRETAGAICAQVAIALTRALAIETYTRAEAAREGERLRTALIDSLTHELRTPLTSIRAAATTLVQNEGIDEAVRADLVALVDEESARLDKLIGEAVEMAEIDANVVQVRAVPQPVRALLEQVVQESSGILARHRTVIEVGDADLTAWFDPQLLGRVFRHLVENAARYSPAGSRIVLSAGKREGRLEFCVADNGPGVDAGDLPLIFEKFYRGKKSGAYGKGTGMGLPIVRAILSAHGGGIRAESRPGAGATFRFWVPLVEREPGREAKPTAGS